MKNKDVTRCSVPLVPTTLQTSLLIPGGISTSALSRSSGLKKAKEKSMKTLTTIAVIAFLLMPSIAEACSDHKRKPVKSSGYANINGTTKSTCR
jgi:hypothetical protein